MHFITKLEIISLERHPCLLCTVKLENLISVLQYQCSMIEIKQSMVENNLIWGQTGSRRPRIYTTPHYRKARYEFLNINTVNEAGSREHLRRVSIVG